MDSQYILTGLQLLYADTDTIKNYCRTNKVARDICNSVDFWLEKFDYDNLPIIGLNNKTGVDYMKEYIKVTDAQQKAKRILNIMSNDRSGLKCIYFRLKINNPNFLKIFSIDHQNLILEVMEKFNQPTDAAISINLKINVYDNLFVDITSVNNHIFSGRKSLSLHITDTFDALTKIYYYYPYIEIKNCAGMRTL